MRKLIFLASLSVISVTAFGMKNMPSSDNNSHNSRLNPISTESNGESTRHKNTSTHTYETLDDIISTLDTSGHKLFVSRILNNRQSQLYSTTKSINIFRKSGLTYSKITKNIYPLIKKGLFPTEVDTRSYLKKTFSFRPNKRKHSTGTLIGCHSLSLRNYSHSYIAGILGLSKSHVGNLCKQKTNQPFQKIDVIARITSVLEKYDKDRLKNVKQAIEELYNKLGLSATRVTELLELPYPETPSEEIVYEKLKAAHPDIIDKDISDNSIDTVRKSISLLLQKKRTHLWEIADFFGVTRNEIKNYISSTNQTQTLENSKPNKASSSQIQQNPPHSVSSELISINTNSKNYELPSSVVNNITTYPNSQTNTIMMPLLNTNPLTTQSTQSIAQNIESTLTLQGKNGLLAQQLLFWFPKATLYSLIMEKKK